MIICGQRRRLLRRRVRLLRVPEHGGQRAAGGARAAGRAGARPAGIHAQGARPCAAASIEDVSARSSRNPARALPSCVTQRAAVRGGVGGSVALETRETEAREM